MASRDDFPVPVKEALAKRAGYRCSFPGCPAVTIGPSNEGATATANTGTAAHIAAAAGGIGARRYVAAMTSDQRKAIENGIWMCRNHGTLVDTDEVRYTVPMLEKWRLLAEARARLRQSLGEGHLAGNPELHSIGLADSDYAIDSNQDENETIGLALQDSCMPDVWGRQISDAVRDFLVEYTRNALTHGSAKHVHLTFDSRRVTVEDNGAPYSLGFLSAGLHGRRGGVAALEVLNRRFAGRIVLSQQFEAGFNKLYIAVVESVENLALITPCTLKISAENLRARNYSFDGLESCDTLYLLLPPFMAFSDGMRLSNNLRSDLPQKRLVFVFDDVSEGVREEIQSAFPHVGILELPPRRN